MMNNNNIRPFPFREKSWRTQILDPGGRLVTQWQQTFLFTCLIALFVDPLYFYLPKISGPACMEIDIGLGISVTFFRTVADLFYLAHMIVKFRIAYVAPTSRVLGRGVLVTDPHKIALRYLKTDFIVDFAATLPLPQVVTWYIIPSIKEPTADHANHIISLIVLLQYIPRLFLIFPLNRRIMKNSGIVARTAWLGAAYNLLLYTLASHVLGAIWYLLAIERNHKCWKDECDKETNVMAFPVCRPSFLDCSSLMIPERQVWLNFTQVLSNCQPDNKVGFIYGMYGDMLNDDVASSTFLEKFFYCLWWGLKSLSSYGQSVPASFFSSETLFCIVICIGGLVLFSDLIGNMQTYLLNMGIRLEEWRVRRRDTEEWMRHRQLPPDLQERIRRFVQYKWIATRGVDEEAILRELPLDIRREIQRHLCLALVLRVPFFSQMDDQLLDAICERLVSSLSTQDAYIVREGDPVNEMLFIIRGQLESSTTNGGRSGFFNSITLRPGDFCGEELLTWALMPNSSLNRPISTRTVKSITKVEAFALRADDLTFVANQFKRLHSKKLQHAFRYYSHQWRTWGACFIQAAWRRMKRKRLAQELARQESLYYMQLSDQDGYFDEMMDVDYAGSSAETSSMENPHGGQQIGATILASRFATNARKGAQKKVTFAVTSPASSLKMPKLFKPEEPDFSADS